MKKLFLASYFKEVYKLLPEFLGKELKGKSISFIKAASLVESVNFYVNEAIFSLEELGLNVDIIDLTIESFNDVHIKLKQNDYIYISGGNTFFLLHELKRIGIDPLLKELILGGKPFIGESAGSIILSPNIEYIKFMDNIKKAPDLESYNSLNIVDFYPIPHSKNFPFKSCTNKIIKNYGCLKLVPFHNSQVILVQGNDICIQNITN